MLNVLFIAFNRPDLLKKSLAVFAHNTESFSLYLHLDGPRPGVQLDNDLIKSNLKTFLEFCNRFKPADYKFFVQTSNLGCRKGVQSAISWFFSNVESGLIVEDDIELHPDSIENLTFLLTKYRNDSSVGSITFYTDKNFFIKKNIFWRKKTWPHIWGWATWRNRWEVYDENVLPITTCADRIRLVKHFGIFRYRNAQSIFRRWHNDNDTWDTQWLYTNYKNRWSNISPSRSLVTNLGFDDRATHTKVQHAKINRADSSEWRFRHYFI